MNTLTTNSQTLTVFEQTAQEIVDRLETLGFTTETPVPNLKDIVSEIVTRNIMGNVNYNHAAGAAEWKEDQQGG